MTRLSDPTPSHHITRWRISLFIIFAVRGMAMATWASRLPAIRDNLGIGDEQLGTIILSLSLGAIIGVALTPRIGSRLGVRGTISLSTLVIALSLGGVALGIALGSVPIVVVSLFVFGLSNGCLDVIANADGVGVEALGERTLLPLMHASYSLGSFIGAGLGTVAASVGLGAPLHLAIIAVVSLVIVYAVLGLVPTTSMRDRLGVAQAPPNEAGTPLIARLAVWRSSGFLMIGLVALGVAFSEASANDWLTIAVFDGHGATDAGAAAMYTVFLWSMFVGRLVGGLLTDRFGRVATVRSCLLISAIGIISLVFGGSFAFVILGAILWGLGSSIGLPLAISAASEGSSRATERVSAISVIGYAAFLIEPPIIGFLSGQVGILLALLAPVVLLIVAILVAGALREHRSNSGLDG